MLTNPLQCAPIISMTSSVRHTVSFLTTCGKTYCALNLKLHKSTVDARYQHVPLVTRPDTLCQDPLLFGNGYSFPFYLSPIFFRTTWSNIILLNSPCPSNNNIFFLLEKPNLNSIPRNFLLRISLAR